MPPKNIALKKRIRRRIGARNYKNYTEDMLLLAVDLVRNKNSTSYEAEKQFGIPRRTIEKRVKNLHTNKPGPRFRLSQEEELKFVKVLIAAGDFGCPLSQLDLKLAVYDYLKKNNKTHVFNDRIPGDWWVKNFLERYKDQLTLRSVQNISRARAEKTLEDFKEYFKNLEISLQNVPPSNILNYDETNVTDNPGSTKCIFRRGVKYPERIVNHSKGCISVMFAGTADGHLLSPYVVYKSENLWSEWCKDGPKGARYNRSKSGWFDSISFFDWFVNIVIPWAKQLNGPKLVIGDNLSSHVNPEVVELCEIHQIRFVFLPPRSTHLTQPLDVAFFGPLKKAWRKILLEYKIENPTQKSLNKTHFPILLKQLIDSAHIKQQNMISGFKATGIYPFNPYEVYKKLPEYEEDIKYDVDQTLLEYLKENKQPKPIKRGRNYKLNVPSGQSVCNGDFSIAKTKNSTVSIVNETNTTTQKKTLKAFQKTAITERKEQDTELKRRKKPKNSTKIMKNKDSKVKLHKKRKYHNKSSTDSDSSCSIPSSSRSEYDLRNDEDTDFENEINKTVWGGINCSGYRNECQNVDGGNEECLIKMGRKVGDVIDDEENDEVIENENKESSHKNWINGKDCEEILKNHEDKTNEDICSINSEKEVNKEGTEDSHSKNSSQSRKITILSDIKNTAENQAYFNLRKYGPFILQAVNTNQELKIKTTESNTKMQSVRINENTGFTQTETTINTESGPTCSEKPKEKILINYNVNDYILIRYDLKNKTKYYVAQITEKLENKYYEVSCFKRIGKNDNIKFVQPKKRDMDTIHEGMIVKQVELLPLNEKETEFVFLDDDNSMYFDY